MHLTIKEYKALEEKMKLSIDHRVRPLSNERPLGKNFRFLSFNKFMAPGFSTFKYETVFTGFL